MVINSVRTIAFRASLLLTVGALAACGPSEQVKQQIAQLQAEAAQKDSLMQEVADNARVMSQISAEIAKVQGHAATATEGTPIVTRDSILASIRAIGARLDSTQARLAASERRIRLLRGRSGAMQKTLSALQTTVANQKETIASLNTQIAGLQAENSRLTAANTALGDTVQNMVKLQNTVYYVVGTKADLLQKGLIKEEGGHRILFIFGKAGKVMVPAGNLDRSQFTAADERELTQIPLPNPKGTYRIVSNQDVSALATPPDKDGKITGSSIQITDPQKFWANSPVLIIVEVS